MTSYLFPDGTFSSDRLQAVLGALDQDKTKLVIDLSCRRQGSKWVVAMNKWQKLTDMEVNESTYISFGSSTMLTTISRIDQISRALLLRVFDRCC